MHEFMCIIVLEEIVKHRRKIMHILFLFIDCIVVFLTANIMAAAVFIDRPLATVPVGILLVLAYIAINVFPGIYRTGRFKLTVLAGGSDLLLAFMITLVPEIAVFTVMVLSGYFNLVQIIGIGIMALITEAIVFWNGIIRVYMTSVQLGLRTRILGAIFGMIFPLNIYFLIKIIVLTRREAVFEIYRVKLEESRKGQDICKTKYPLLLVHGVFFRDSKALNYWGRTPETLIQNGAEIYYGDQQSALSVIDSAHEIAGRIEEIIRRTGAEKVNIIAHSKGGLDCRYAISNLGMDKYVASLTTVNTPHHGCLFVEHLFNKIAPSVREKMALAYNTALKKIGDKSPDFLAAVGDLRNSRVEELNAVTPDMEGVFYQSCGSMARKAKSGRFPLNVSYPLVKKYDGANDGLVATESMKWGDNFRLVSVKGKRGVTHADMIDLNRENVPGFDVREFYVGVVSDLKNRGF